MNALTFIDANKDAIKIHSSSVDYLIIIIIIIIIMSVFLERFSM